MIATARAAGSGSGDAVIFVHGVGSTAAIWDAQLRALSDRYRCFAVELRGNGVAQPEPAPETVTRQGFAEDTLAVADAAGAQRFHFVGCSLGGVVGFELCARVPDRIASLTLVGSFAAYPEGAAYAESVVREVREAGSMERFARERVRKLGLPPGPRTDETIGQMACKCVASYVAATRATWTGDYRLLLGNIRAPALILFGERDAVAPEPLASEIANGIAGARLVEIPKAGHVANADSPERFNRELVAFLQENTIRSAAL